MCKSAIKKIIILLAVILIHPSFLYALDLDEILVIANKNASKSVGLAKYYMEKRGIPEKNLVTLFITDKETITRENYNKKVIPPLRNFLKSNNKIRALVTLYGMPLRISSTPNSPAEETRLKQLNAKIKGIEDKINDGDYIDLKIRKEKHDELSTLKKTLSNFKKGIDKVASLDSELSLVMKDDYTLNMWLPNPFYIGNKDLKNNIKKSDVFMTCRLDGADQSIVKRIINDSIEAEKEGLKGSAYFDARWKDPGTQKKSGYGFYDQSIHLAAKSLSKTTGLKVIINDEPGLFQHGESPDTALYCGWYSLAKYVDAFTWQKGSVGYHIASSECVTLKNENSQVWCKKMLDNGIAATIGPVGEPYVQAFPVPEVFFTFLTEGYLTLAESYLISLPYLSWKMVLIGDPLYRLNVKLKEI